MITTVFFDAAGTLLQTRRPIGELYGTAAAEFGFSRGAERPVQQQIGEAFAAVFRAKSPLTGGGPPQAVRDREREWWREVVSETFASLGPFPGLESCFDTLYRMFQTSRGWRLEPGGPEVLEELRSRGLRLGVVSNFDSRLFGLLEELEIRKYLDAVVVSSLAPAAKPDRRIFHCALERLGARAEESLHVGDSLEEDYCGALGAGLNALLYDPGRKTGPEWRGRRIGQLQELPSFLL